MTFFVLGPVCCTSIPQTPSSILPTPIPLNSVFTRALVPKKRSAPAQPPLMRAEAVPRTGPINPRGSTYPRGKGGACKLQMALQPEDDEAAAALACQRHSANHCQRQEWMSQGLCLTVGCLASGEDLCPWKTFGSIVAAHPESPTVRSFVSACIDAKEELPRSSPEDKVSPPEPRPPWAGGGGACKSEMALQPENDEAATDPEFLFYNVENKKSARELVSMRYVVFAEERALQSVHVDLSKLRGSESRCENGDAKLLICDGQCCIPTTVTEDIPSQDAPPPQGTRTVGQKTGGRTPTRAERPRARRGEVGVVVVAVAVVAVAAAADEPP
ncbi:hypothetical protein J1605_003850 [Eschrichtius robustus]|uniref:Uncharacterized protein n=1 Tax=Eschrichtius robustus TaxID=9764 RepID=A0AB34HLS1_ESCRO|nr:hypothetical protein J1605_003850 [Eschrichtius robustus]